MYPNATELAPLCKQNIVIQSNWTILSSYNINIYASYRVLSGYDFPNFLLDPIAFFLVSKRPSATFDHLISHSSR